MTEKTIRKHLYNLGYLVRKAQNEYVIIDYDINGIVRHCASWDEVKDFLSDLQA